jgi:hypothetical protein
MHNSFCTTKNPMNSTPWQASITLAGQKFPRLLCYPKFHYRDIQIFENGCTWVISTTITRTLSIVTDTQNKQHLRETTCFVPQMKPGGFIWGSVVFVLSICDNGESPCGCFIFFIILFTRACPFVFILRQMNKIQSILKYTKDAFK